MCINPYSPTTKCFSESPVRLKSERFDCRARLAGNEDQGLAEIEIFGDFRNSRRVDRVERVEPNSQRSVRYGVFEKIAQRERSHAAAAHAKYYDIGEAVCDKLRIQISELLPQHRQPHREIKPAESIRCGVTTG